MKLPTSLRPPQATCRWRRALAASVVVGVAVSTVTAFGAPRVIAQQGPAPPGAVVPSSGSVVDAVRPSLSADGRWLVFEGSVEGRRSVFRTDRVAGETIELSPLAPSARAGDTVHPRISADACVVVAVTQIAYDLFRDDDTGERWDVYRLVVPECGGQANDWELVSSVDRVGIARDDASPDSPPALTGAGAEVAFVHPLEGAPEGVTTISVVDLTVPITEPGRIENVAGMPAEPPGGAFLYRGARDPVLSQNGRHLAFVADVSASDALPGWASGPVRGEHATSQVYVWDRGAPDQRRAVRLISGRDGVPSEAGGSAPAISEDGRVVTFVSAGRTLVPATLPGCTSHCPTQVYRFDRDTDGNGIFDEAPRRPQLAIVSAVDAGVVDAGLPIAGDGASWSPAISADGSQVAFVSDATNLLASRRSGGGGDDDGDLLVAEFELGQLRRVLDGSGDTDVPGAHSRPVLSKTGQVIAFDTAAAASFGEPAGRRAVMSVEVRPQLSLAELDFGTVLNAFDSTELFTTVRNAGPAAFEPMIVESSSPNFRVTGGTCRRGVIVAAGASCEVRIVFNPTAPQGFTGRLTVRSLGAGAPSVSAELRGAAGEPAILTNPGGIDLADGIVGTAAGREAIDVENVGFVPTEVVGLGFTGAHAGDFRIVTESCTRRALNVDASCSVVVEFVPRGPGYRSASLIVTAAPPPGIEGRPYTAAVLGGYARYEPLLQTVYTNAEQVGEPNVVVPGRPAWVGGRGFPADATLTIGFDGAGEPFATVETTSEGTFLVELTIPVRSRIGPRTLIAAAPGGVVAAAAIEVTGRVERTRPVVPGFGLG